MRAQRRVVVRAQKNCRAWRGIQVINQQDYSGGTYKLGANLSREAMNTTATYLGNETRRALDTRSLPPRPFTLNQMLPCAFCE
jgi:hypothetical protein